MAKAKLQRSLPWQRPLTPTVDAPQTMGNAAALKSQPSVSHVCTEAAPKSIAVGTEVVGAALGRLVGSSVMIRSNVVASASTIRSTHSINM